MKKKVPKKKTNELPVVEITHYELMMDGAKPIQHPVKNTYTHKKDGDIVKIDWIDGAFRLL